MEKGNRTILDHGKVVLLDVFGSDTTILDAARVSYSSNKHKAHTPKENRGLMRYLVRHKHTSPLEMAVVKFYLKMPIFVARQLVRHRTASLNEVSGRYSELPDELYVPDVDQCGPQSPTNNQGRAPVVNEINATQARHAIANANREAANTYDSLLTIRNISREMARSVLPLSTYTEMHWQCNLHNFFHFCQLRMDSHAQYEIRVMATAMYELTVPYFPLACEAWEDYILCAHTFSRHDTEMLRRVLRGEIPTLNDAVAIGQSAREYNEFMSWVESIRHVTTRER